MNEEELIEKYSDKLAGFTLETFQSLTDNSFVHTNEKGDKYELVLEKVEEGKYDRDIFDSFSLFFTSRKDVIFQQGHYLLEQKELGKFALFLAPVVSIDFEKNSYQVSFSRMKKQKA